MTIALSLRILAMKIYVDVDQMQNVLESQILVRQGPADVVRIMNAPRRNIVTLENAKVHHL